jgi:hypothetical protein
LYGTKVVPLGGGANDTYNVLPDHQQHPDDDCGGLGDRRVRGNDRSGRAAAYLPTSAASPALAIVSSETVEERMNRKLEGWGVIVCLLVLVSLMAYDLFWCPVHGLLVGGVR